MRVETWYFDKLGARVPAREAVSGEVRQYDDDGRLLLTVHLQNDGDGWQQVRALHEVEGASGGNQLFHAVPDTAARSRVPTRQRPRPHLEAG